MPIEAIGGVFLSSHDPARLLDWFEAALGVDVTRHDSGGNVIFRDGEAFSLIGVHPARDGAPAPPDGPVEREPYGRQAMMVNLRVDDLDSVVARLRQSDNEVVGPEEYEGMGRFAWARTPDGHDIELWQP